MGQITDFYNAFVNQLGLIDGYIQTAFGRKEVNKLKGPFRVIIIPNEIKYVVDTDQTGINNSANPGKTSKAIEQHGTDLVTFNVLCYAPTYDDVFKVQQKCKIALKKLYGGSRSTVEKTGDNQDIFYNQEGAFYTEEDQTAKYESIGFTVTVGMIVFNQEFDLTTIENIGNCFYYDINLDTDL